MNTPPTFPLEELEGLHDPFPYFAKCRRDTPILFHEPWRAWFVFSHDDIVALTRDPRLSSKRMDLFRRGAPENVQGQLQFLETDLGSMVVMLDGDEHHRVRQNLQRGFTPRTIQALQSRIVSHAESLIEGVKGAGACDIDKQICRMLPLLVLADLFALPAEDFPRLQRWAYDFVEYFNRQPVPAPHALALARSGKEMMAYTKALIAERRANPGTDLISALVTSPSEEEGFTDDEIVANVLMVLIAGNDTVGSELGNAVYLLLSHPEQLERVRAGEASWEDAFEECLRYEPANPVIMRKVGESFEFKGHAFQRQQAVFLVLASGSRDEAHFSNPETFDVSRADKKHLTFGGGIHFCVGAALARAQAQALLPRLFEGLPGLRLDSKRDVEWLRTLGVRGPRALPVIFNP